MLSYTLRRLLSVVFVIWGVTVATFFIAQVVPADPALAALGDHARDDQIQAFRAAHGLDKPAYVQYALYLGDVLRGNLGTSLRTGRSILDDLRDFFPATIELAFTALLIAALIGVPAGVLAALYQDRWPDLAVRLLALLGGATPVYWIAIVALQVLHSDLGWLPGPGRLDPYLLAPPRVTGMVGVDALLAGDWEVWRDALRHLILPALVLGAFSAALLARMARSSMLEVLSQDFVRTARAKGVRGARVVWVHAARNAALPVLTVLGSVLGGLLSGAVLTETIFSWPGIGQYATAAAVSLDFPAVMGVTLVAGLAYALVNLVTDLLYALLDPRISYG